MLYPVYIRRNKDATCHVTFPDFMSCFKNIRGRSYLTQNFKHAIEHYLRERNLQDVQPSKARDWLSDRRFKGGYWIMMDLNPEDRGKFFVLDARYISQEKIDL